MPTYIGENKIVDRYLGDKFLEAAYIGDEKVYDPYTEITDYLPMIFKSRATVALKNYRIRGTPEGAGVETENLFDKSTAILGKEIQLSSIVNNSAWAITPLIPVKPQSYYSTLSFGIARLEYMSENDNNPTRTTASSQYPTLSTTHFIRLNLAISDLTTATIVSGSTPPDHYIPYGYKLPLTVESGETENLFDWEETVGIKNNYYINQEGQEVNNTSYYLSYPISIVAQEAYTWSWGGTNVHSAPTVGFYDSNDNLIGVAQHNSTVNSFSFTIPSNCSYIKASVYKTNNDMKGAMLTKGSTAPSTYIPHRYTSDVSIYIGDSKLLADEYVDFGEQKVYKRTENLWDGTFYQGSVNSPRSVSRISTHNIPVELGMTYSLKLYGELPSICDFAFVVRNGISIIYDSNWKDTETFVYTMPQDTGVYYAEIIIKRKTEGKITPSYVKSLGNLTLIKDSTPPETYIPYLQPTDPPVPLPPIPTYKGENTLSSTETLGEVTVKGRIRELTYKRLSYIKSSDGSAYIDTDITGLNAATDYIEAEMSFGVLNYVEDGAVLFGCATAYDGHWNLFGAACNGYEQDATVRTNHFYSYVNYSTGGSGTIKRMRVVTNGDFSSKLLFSVKTPQSTITNLETGTVYTPSVFDPNWDAASLQPIDFVQTASFTVFAGQYYRSADNIVYYKSHRNAACYGVRIYRNDVLIHNLVPVEREDRELGLLDIITNKFYANAGTGTFEKGEYI